MKALFIGGTGTISSACSVAAITYGIDLTLFLRGKSQRAAPEGIRIIHGDIRNQVEAQQALADQTFDVVVNWVSYIPQHIETDLALFQGRVGQYIFISSASAYQTPPLHLPVTEATPLDNPFWQYSRDKIACEERLIQAYRNQKFPVTIVRPSHTYDQTLIPLHGGYTNIDRMRRGKPIIIHGDGTSLWVLTHHRDFAQGFTGLLGNSHALGRAVQITSDELLTWNQIAETLAKAAGLQPKLEHIPSEVIATYDTEWGASLLGDKSHSMIFDNTLIKQLVPGYKAVIPFERGAQEIIDWYAADLSRQIVDTTFDTLCEHILADWNAFRQRIKVPA